MTTLNDAIKLTPRQSAVLRTLLNSPLTGRVLEEAEHEALEARRALASDLDALRKRAVHEAPSRLKDKLDADAELARLERDLPSAHQRAQEAAARLHSAQRVKAIGKVERALRMTADERIGTFRFFLEVLADRARTAFRSWAGTEPAGAFSAPRTVVATNHADVSTARQTLAECIARTREIELTVLAYGELTAELIAMCEALQRPLATLQLNPPQLSNAGEVGAPLAWVSRGSLFLVDEIEAPMPKPTNDHPMPLGAVS